MAKKEEKKRNLFSKAFDYLGAIMDERIQRVETEQNELSKAKAPAMSEDDDFDNALYRKSVYKDPAYTVGTQGYQEKTARLSFDLLRHMAKTDTTVMGIIQTRQNQVAAYSKSVKGDHDKGFKIVLCDEEEELEQLKRKMFPEKYGKEDKDLTEKKRSEQRKDEVQETTENLSDPQIEEITTEESSEEEISDKEMTRLAREKLKEETKEDIENLTRLVETCGSLEGRPFETQRWDFDAFLRAITRDSLTYDFYCIERIEDNADRLSYWVPIDASTVRFATPQLKNYKDFNTTDAGYDILFPEKELQAMRDKKEDILKLDNEKLEKDEYKYVQIVRGRIERAFTPSELVVGMRNPVTDIYANGYSLAELELLLSIISSHIFTENYNKLYFTNGFSAKGILHVKANLPRRKLETLRLQWKHMVSGNRNSFQTPILAGMEEVQWIPLTQSHSDMEFDKWLNYLIKTICMVYQIDPSELGFGMKDEGGKGGGLSGDNTKEKMEHSKSRGLEPLLRHIETFLNKNIICKINPRYRLEFVGINNESRMETVDREMKEVKYSKTVNEIRAERGLPPIEGADDVILDPVWFQWYDKYHPKAKQLQEEMAKQGMQQNGDLASPEMSNFFESEESAQEETTEKSLKKSLVRIEHYDVES